MRNGHIKRITDNDIQSLVLEIVGTNVSTTFISCPADPCKTLGIKLSFLVMIIKNLKKYFTFEVQVRAVGLSTVTFCKHWFCALRCQVLCSKYICCYCSWWEESVS